MDTDLLLTQLVEALDRDLELIRVIRYRLTVLSALAAADQGPWLPGAIDEMAAATAALHSAEQDRAQVTGEVARAFGLPPATRIEALAVPVGGAWGDVLLERRRALTEAVTGVQGLAATVSGVMGRRASLAEEALAFLGGDGNATYGRTQGRGALLVEGAI